MPQISMYICMALLGSMSTEIIDVDTTTCNAAISACEKAGGKGEALVFLGSVETERVDIAPSRAQLLSVLVRRRDVGGG